jgi:membrane carboxypeptidase/penicillin-binding protein
MLEGAVARGTARKAKELGVPVLAKTGTSNDSRDVWCLGGTPNIVVGVFIGADTPQCLGKHATGGTLAAPVFVDFLKRVLPLFPSLPFKAPRGICFRRIHRLTGHAATSVTDPETILEAFKSEEQPEEIWEERGPIPTVTERPPEDGDDLGDLWEQVVPDQEEIAEPPAQKMEEPSENPNPILPEDSLSDIVDETFNGREEEGDSQEEGPSSSFPILY